MPRQTDSTENNIIDGNLTILPGLNVDNGPGNLEVHGAIYTDTISENTLSNGVILEGTKFSDNYFIMTNISSPSTPSINTHVFYVDSVDSFFKSINSSGVVKIYNPLVNKGEVLTHNGTIDTVLPIGTPGQILISNPTTSTGLEWSNPNISIRPSENIFTLLDKNITHSTYVLHAATGSYYVCIAPLIPLGASCILFSSKSIPTNTGSVYKMCNNISLSQSGNLFFLWDPYKSGRVYKDYVEADGDYLNYHNAQFITSSISLSGTSWVSLGTNYSNITGAYFISVSSSLEGPCLTIAICKSDSTLNSAASFIITSSQSVSGNNLNIRWLSGLGIEISKTTSNDSGTYNVINNFQYVTSTSVSLSGVATTMVPKTLFQFYEQRTFIMRVYSSIANSPKSIFFMSKNLNTIAGIQTSVNSPGKTTLEKLYLTWNANSLLSIYKDGINYDGTYTIDISQF
jgi:hypothetical protein